MLYINTLYIHTLYMFTHACTTHAHTCTHTHNTHTQIYPLNPLHPDTLIKAEFEGRAEDKL